VPAREIEREEVRRLNQKTDKELAFLHDLYVATDWGERFAQLVDEHVTLPAEGRALYVAAGTGGHAMALQERAGDKLSFVCVDDNDECLELARAKATAISDKAEFQRENTFSLSFADDHFDLVLGDASMVAPGNLSKMLSEMVRVATPGATVGWWLPTASSFGEFYSIYWEALQHAGLEEYYRHVENLITERPSVSQAEALSEGSGLEEVNSWTTIEEFDYQSSEQFFNSPLIEDFLLNGWLKLLPPEAQPEVTEEIAKIIDEERHAGEFALSMKATLVVGKKSRTH
jgi:ubiquinone/menaquinone biosynthesis C-methylase UbiE